MTTAPESRAARASKPVPTIGASGFKKRHALALHVRSHQGTVSVIMLKERNQACDDRDQLLWRNVHVGDFAGLNLQRFALIAGPADRSLRTC